MEGSQFGFPAPEPGLILQSIRVSRRASEPNVKRSGHKALRMAGVGRVVFQAIPQRGAETFEGGQPRHTRPEKQRGNRKARRQKIHHVV